MPPTPDSYDSSSMPLSQHIDATSQTVIALGQRLTQITERLHMRVIHLSAAADRGSTPQTPDDLTRQGETTLAEIQHGQAAAIQLERAAQRLLDGTETAPPLFPQPHDGLEHPLVRLAHAYRAAFDAHAVALLLMDDRAPMPGEARGLVERAAQAARLLNKLADLIYRGRGLGTVAHLCENVGALENQADALYRSAVSALFRANGAPSESGATSRANNADDQAPTRWTAERAWRFHLLCALEALTDRCEDIADELMLVDYALT